MASAVDLARVKLERLEDGNYRLYIGSAGVRPYNRKFVLPNLAAVDVLLIHHFEGHLTERADCLLCVRTVERGYPGKGDKTHYSKPRTKNEYMRDFRITHPGHDKQYQQNYYLNVVKPKREAARKARKGRTMPLLIRRYTRTEYLIKPTRHDAL